MRDDLAPTLDDARLIAALTQTTIALAADAATLESHAAQCAFVTAALLMARSGHRIYLDAPDVALVHPQPPLPAGTLISALGHVGRDLLPGIAFAAEPVCATPDLVVVFGATPIPNYARETVRLNATAWSGHLVPLHASEPWGEPDWPFGSLVAAALAAGEAFKCSLRSLRQYATNLAQF